MKRKYSCARCRRHRSLSFLRPIGENWAGLYCPTCRKEIERAMRTNQQYIEAGRRKRLSNTESAIARAESEPAEAERDWRTH